MSGVRPYFTTFTKALTWASLFAFAFLPLGAVITGDAQPASTVSSLEKPALWSLFIVAAFFYARNRCSCEDRLYDDGLYHVASFMGVGTTGVSFLLILPSLFFTLFASVALAAYNDLRGQKDSSPNGFYRLIVFLYKNRLNR